MAPPRRPDPPPLEVEDPRVVGAGMVLWIIALVVLVVLDLAGTSIPGWWTWMCVAGAGLGVLGFAMARKRHQRARERA